MVIVQSGVGIIVCERVQTKGLISETKPPGPLKAVQFFVVHKGRPLPKTFVCIREPLHVRFPMCSLVLMVSPLLSLICLSVTLDVYIRALAS